MFIIYFTLLIICGEIIAIKAILCNQWEKGVSARAVAKEINDVKGPGTVNKYVAQNWFGHF